MMMMLVGVVLSVNTTMIYHVRHFVHDAEVYFYCLQVRILLKQINVQCSVDNENHFRVKERHASCLSGEVKSVGHFLIPGKTGTRLQWRPIGCTWNIIKRRDECYFHLKRLPILATLVKEATSLSIFKNSLSFHFRH